MSSALAKGGGYALKLPVIDVSEVGAGGGSIVRIDAGHALKVGPDSAGAVPGPACYGAGGTNATVTDANVVLGYLNPQALAGGTVPIHAALSREAIERTVCAPLDRSLLDAAWGIYRLANSAMMRAKMWMSRPCSGMVEPSSSTRRGKPEPSYFWWWWRTAAAAEGRSSNAPLSRRTNSSSDPPPNRAEANPAPANNKAGCQSAAGQG